MATTNPRAPEVGNDDASGEPVGNRPPGDASSPAGLEVPAGDRGAASGRNQEQLERAQGVPQTGPRQSQP